MQKIKEMYLIPFVIPAFHPRFNIDRVITKSSSHPFEKLAYIIYLTLHILENFDLIIAEKLRDGAINISCKRQVYYFGDIVHRIKVCVRLSKKMVHQ